MLPSLLRHYSSKDIYISAISSFLPPFSLSSSLRSLVLSFFLSFYSQRFTLASYSVAPLTVVRSVYIEKTNNYSAQFSRKIILIFMSASICFPILVFSFVDTEPLEKKISRSYPSSLLGKGRLSGHYASTNHILSSLSYIFSSSSYSSSY